FRNRHIAVGGGSQSDLGNNTYGRVYNKNGITDKVVIAISQSGSAEVNVSGIFADGTSVKNYYDGSTGTVSGGKVTFSAGTNGVILIEEN
ncbi:MAG TPA: alpha-amylase, partial [Spirochaetota bacterium]|nr:alpha-amylase [Spirochaetota bacterium]